MKQKTTLFTKASLTLFAVFFSFAGARAQQALPYEYGFEDNDLSIDGWVLQGATSSNTCIETNTNAAHNGTHGFTFYYSEQNAYLISPLLTGGEKGINVSFYYGEYSNQYGDEEFQVGYTTDETVTDASEFTYGDIITASVDWQEYTGTFPAGTKRIAIKYVYGDHFYFYLDDFSFIGPDMPTNLTAKDITTTSATISWTGVADSYNFRYAKASEASEWVTVNNATSPYTIEGLTPGTTYKVQVQSVYGEETGVWAQIAFTTEVTNPVPSNIEADLVADGATLTWEGKGDSYKVRYRVPAESIGDMSVWEQIGSDITATGDEETYTFDLSGYTGTGYIAIRHYKVTDEFYLNVDDITVTNAGGETILSEDFSSGSLPESWDIIDYDGDGYEWDIRDLNNSSGYCATSASYVNYVGAVTPDNWLIIPNVELGGKLTFVAYGQDPSYASEVFGVFVTQQSYKPVAGEWTEVAVTDATATISGLATNSTYEYQIQSIKEGEETSEWSELGEFALVTLDCEGDNEDLIKKFNGKFAHVTLANRTFFQDGTWNTIYLPFDMTLEEVAASPLADADVRMFEGSSVNDDTVTLNFTAEGEALGAYVSYGYSYYIGGMPYIVKWASGTGIENPAFANVTITTKGYYAGDQSGDVMVKFYGTYDSYTFDEDDTSVLFVGADNKLNYPLAGATIGATRGYFELTGVTAGEGSGAKQFVMNFGDEDPTAIANISSVKESSEWYDLNGRKLADKPSMKGIYVNGGRKVAIK